MAEPALRPYSNQFYGRIFGRSRIRDRLGPDDPIFHLLESLAIRDVYTVTDEFVSSLDTTLWTATNSGGAGVSNFARLANTAGGVIEGDPGTDNNGDVRLFTTSNECWLIDNRPVALARVRPATAITNSKFEFGFADAVQAGQVNVKATPTSTGTDYAVIVRDTTHNTSIDLVSDGTTPAVELVAGTHGVTWTLDTWHSLMIALNEQDECYFWANGSLGGRIDANGPDNDITLGIWLYMQNRTTTSHPLDVDYVKVIAERVAL